MRQPLSFLERCVSQGATSLCVALRHLPVRAIADELITLNGKSGQIIRVLETDGYPILITHWQSLASNGLFTGLRVLDEVGRRVNLLLSDRVEWMSFEEITRMVAGDKENYPCPEFDCYKA